MLFVDRGIQMVELMYSRKLDFRNWLLGEQRVKGYTQTSDLSSLIIKSFPNIWASIFNALNISHFTTGKNIKG
jgi:hypothetical protein